VPSISYTALRSIERTSFSANNKLTIAATSTGSPNVSTFTDSNSPGNLAGINSGEWIYITGFSIEVNNGWHQVSVNSTTGLITVSTILTAESAGSSITILGYLRGFGQVYSFDTAFTSDDRNRVVTKAISTSLGGNIETLSNRRENFYNILSQVLDSNGTDYPQFIEFLDSCESGESFTFDRVGTIAIPDNAITVYLDGNGYTEQRLANITDRRISFRIRS